MNPNRNKFKFLKIIRNNKKNAGECKSNNYGDLNIDTPFIQNRMKI